MVLGFNKRFVEPTLAGTKIHTIRDDKNDRWHAGMQIHFATGVRTKNYKQFKEGKCISTQEVFMTYYNGLLEITVDDTYLFGYPDREKLAKNDGFDSLEAFEAWFIPLCKKNKDSAYKGKLIHWTAFKY